MNTTYDFERFLFGQFDQLRVSLLTRPLYLGGTYGYSGGIGGSPGGFIGQLPQSRISFDLTEAETFPFNVDASGNPSGTSLVTNLNRIRYRIKQLEDGSAEIYNDNVFIARATVMNFSSDFVVTTSASGVDISLSGPKITVSAIAPSSPNVGDLWVDIS